MKEKTNVTNLTRQVYVTLVVPPNRANFRFNWKIKYKLRDPSSNKLEGQPSNLITFSDASKAKEWLFKALNGKLFM